MRQSKTPAIQELIEKLGKRHQGIQKRFKMTAGIHKNRSSLTRPGVTLPVFVKAMI